MRIQILVVGLILMATGAEAQNARWFEERDKDNKSIMAYAEKDHERLAKIAMSWHVDPNYVSGRAAWIYKMRDGTTTICLRGMSSGLFVYECQEH